MAVPYFNRETIADGTYMLSYAFGDDIRVMAYLVDGADYALLIDTMNGWGDLKGFCETLTDKPIKLVNTHFHLDHTGGNFQFDSCYLHPKDLALFNDSLNRTREQYYEGAVKAARPEYAAEIKPEDFTPCKPMKVYPIEDGDIFDLGDREISVVYVGGHTPGSIALIDHKTRIAFTGDCCNGNTLLHFSTVSLESYMRNLLHFKEHQGEFDICYGGHQILPVTIIDEGIEVTARTIIRKDENKEYPFFNRIAHYALTKDENGLPANGGLFNLSYDPENIMDKPATPQIIK